MYLKVGLQITCLLRDLVENQSWKQGFLGKKCEAQGASNESCRSFANTYTAAEAQPAPLAT